VKQENTTAQYLKKLNAPNPKLENFNRSIHLQNRVGAEKMPRGRKNRVLGEFFVDYCVPALLALE